MTQFFTGKEDGLIQKGQSRINRRPSMLYCKSSPGSLASGSDERHSHPEVTSCNSRTKLASHAPDVRVAAVVPLNSHWSSGADLSCSRLLLEHTAFRN